jgi:hypothetical protein
MDTLQDAKHLLRDNFGYKRVDCPCCHQQVYLYPRKITGVMALALVELYREHQRLNDFNMYIHLSELLETRGYGHRITNTGDKAKLKYWELIEPMIGVRKDGSNKVGRYKITTKGILFVEGRVSVPSKIGLYNQQVYALPPHHEIHPVFIKDVWDLKFDYAEMMGYK